jgi:AcrR family transcriptional regulator
MSDIAPKKLDRRIARTRAMLKKALLALIVERSYDTLTIQDITDKADLRRATFYLHYRDKEELLLSALQESFDALASSAEHLQRADMLGGKTQVEAFLVTLNHVAEHHHLYRALLTSGSGALIARRIQEYLARLILRGLPDSGVNVPREVLANFVAGAELSLITWWLDNHMPYSTERLAAMLHQLTLNGALSAFERR